MLWLKSENITLGGDGLVVRWKHPASTVEISASRNGVMVQGCSPAMGPDDASDFARQVMTAKVIAGRLYSGTYARDKNADTPFPRGDFKGHPVQTGACV